MTQKVLGYDLGGTKVAVAVVDSNGRILEETREPARIREGRDVLIRQLASLGKKFLARHPAIKQVGIASAGPLDPKRGVLLDPTNFAGPGWGQVPLAKLLSKKLGLPVVLENDAAAAILAEHWLGLGRGLDNVMIMTLGTGLGTGIIANGALVRGGRGMHPEGGHLILSPNDQSAPCGCGNLGCAEAYLSGRNFTHRARRAFGLDEDDKTLDAAILAELARGQGSDRVRARALFDDYADMLAVAMHNFTVLYCPELIVLTGSFALAADLFLDRARAKLELRLSRRRVGIDLLPKVLVSSLDNRAGVLGAAYIALASSGISTRVISKTRRKKALRKPVRVRNKRKKD